MQDDLQRIACETVGGMQCPSDYRCAAGGVDSLCAAYDFPLQQFLKCLGGSSECPFFMPFNHDGICQCPLRRYLVQKLDVQSGLPT